MVPVGLVLDVAQRLRIYASVDARIKFGGVGRKVIDTPYLDSLYPTKNRSR